MKTNVEAAALQHEQLHVFVDELARVGDVQRSFDLVPRQHPHLDVGFQQYFYRVRHPVLQLVFYGSCPEKVQVLKNRNKNKLR